MNYFELKIEADDPVVRDILMGRLVDAGFESFEEKESSLLAYIPSDKLDFRHVHQIMEEFRLTHHITEIPKRNWNEEWEMHYDPVLISGQCYIRAPFHPPLEGIRFDIIIEPKMSFGTAHHETTSLMIELMMESDLEGRKVLDMGCGTGILAIFARKLGAGEVVAVDIDEWAVQNAMENALMNGEDSIRVIHGDIRTVKETGFDSLLANINRNILLDDMDAYGRIISAGELCLSGFFKEDMPAIIESAEKHGFSFRTIRSKNQWVAIKFTK